MFRFLTKLFVQNSSRTHSIKRHFNHYEVLELPRDCTRKQIKESFIRLSKKYHPDKNNDKCSHVEFVKITTAYNILSKPELRRDYDLGLHAETFPKQNTSHTTVYTTTKNPWDDPLFWHNSEKRQDANYRSQPYYGINGVKKLPNLIIVLICCCITAVGVCLQLLAIRHSVTLKRDHLLKKSEEAESVLQEVRENALTNGNTKQFEIMKERLRQSRVP